MLAKPMTGNNAAGDINFHRCQKACEKLEFPWSQPSTAKGPGQPRRDVQYVPQGATKPCPEWLQPGVNVVKTADDVLKAVAESTRETVQLEAETGGGGGLQYRLQS